MKKVINFTITTQNIKESLLIKKINQITRGFSLVELLVSVAIIGILSRTAYVAYPTYIVKSQVTSTMTLLESYVKAAESYYVEHNTNNNGFAGLSSISSLGGFSPGNTSVVGSISVTYSPGPPETLTLGATFNSNANSDLNGKVFNLVITANNGTFDITCNSPSIPNNSLPSKCQS